MDDMKLSKKDIPDVVLVRKYFPKYRKKDRSRYWKLKRMNMETQDMNVDGEEEDEEAQKYLKKKSKRGKRPKKTQEDKMKQKV